MPARRRFRARARFAALPVAVLLACTVEHDAPPVAPRDATSPASTTTVPTRQRGLVIGGEKVARTITWPAADKLAIEAHARYDLAARDAIDRSTVPVLGPADPLARATVTVGAHWYALTVHDEGYSMHVDGSGRARVYPHLKAFERTHPMRAADGFLTRNEGIWSATWIEHGAAYSLEIECDPRMVKWCDDEQAVLDRVSALVYLGGEEVRR